MQLNPHKDNMTDYLEKSKTWRASLKIKYFSSMDMLHWSNNAGPEKRYWGLSELQLLS